MERQKMVKVMTIGMSVALFTPTLLTGLSTLLQKSQPPANSAPTPVSQDAQFAAQENGYVAVLKKEPNNSTALRGLEEVATAYVADRNLPKAIEIYQKLIKAAPTSPQVPQYQQRLAALQKQGSAQPPLSPSAKP
jgi:hypothetical protein